VPPSLTVSMSYWHCRNEVGRAVESILGQTYRDLRLVVVNDGDEPPPLAPDPRLTILNLAANHGPYYCDAVALAACDTEWFTIHAADDWSEPDRFERLMAETEGYDAVFGGAVEHRGDQIERRWTRFDRILKDELHHVGSIATGVYRTQALRSVGGPHPEYRVVYDTMMVHLVLRGLRWKHLTDEYGYHRVVRPDSLTRDPATGLHSDYRQRWRDKRDKLWKKVIAAPQADWPRLLAPSPEITASVAADAARLRTPLAAQAVAA
jgi:glycosyltransferase involved in cell wall biosynthesis